MSTIPTAALQHAASPTFLHPWREVDIGPNQGVTIDGKGQQSRVLYDIEGVANPSYVPTAQLTINDAQHFHGAIELGSYAGVALEGVSATSYTFDATRDLLRLYQGDKVVDTVNLASPLGVRVQSGSGGTGGDWTYVSTGYHGLSYGIGLHV